MSSARFLIAATIFDHINFNKLRKDNYMRWSHFYPHSLRLALFTQDSACASILVVIITILYITVARKSLSTARCHLVLLYIM